MSPFEITSPADIGSDRTLLFWLDRELTVRARVRLRFALYWLREMALGEFEPELRREIDSGVDALVRGRISGTLLAAVAVGEDGRLRLRVSRWRTRNLRVEARGEHIICDFGGAEAPRGRRPALQMREQALRAVEKKCAVELCRRVLLDSSFDFTAEGLAAYRFALTGQSIEERLGEVLGGVKTIEVHLPVVNRWAWPKRWDALASAHAATEEDGRIFVYTDSRRTAQKNTAQATLALAAPLLYPECPGSEMSFTDTRVSTAAELGHTLPRVVRPYGFGSELWEWLGSAPKGEVSVSASLSIRSGAAGAWLRAPGEKDSNFFDVYSRVSVAMQQALRRWLPYVYFSDHSRFEDLTLAYPLVYYRSTYPCSGRPRSEFAYDLVSPDRPGIARAWAARPLASSLARAEKQLIAAGRRDLARYYSSWRARDVLEGIVQRPRFINALLTTDAFLIDRVVGLGVAGRELASRFAENPRRAAKDLAIFLEEFAAVINRKVRRLYGGRDCTSLGALLLVEATAALCAALDGERVMSATLRVEAGGRSLTVCGA